MTAGHRDHTERCPGCGRVYLCREAVCRLVCARCEEALRRLTEGVKDEEHLQAPRP
jgi:hypothetical protein